MWVAGWVVGGCCFGWRFPQPAKNARTWETGKEWKESAVDSWKQAWLHTTHGKSLQKQREGTIVRRLGPRRNEGHPTSRWLLILCLQHDSSFDSHKHMDISWYIKIHHEGSMLTLTPQPEFHVPRHSLHLGRRLQQRPSFGSAGRGPLGRWHLRGCLSPPAQRGRRGGAEDLGKPRDSSRFCWFIMVYHHFPHWNMKAAFKSRGTLPFWTTPFGGIWFNRWSVAWFRARGNPTRSDGLSTFPLNQFSERVN